MMSTKRLNTSLVTADSPKGQRAVETFRAKYNKVRLTEKEAQFLNENPDFAAYLETGIRKFSAIDLVFPTFLEIEVGGKNKKKLLTELESKGCFVSDLARDIMFRPAWKPGKKEKVKFARVEVRDLGFSKNPTIMEIQTYIKDLGHSLCEPGDGPAIRLALGNQPRGDSFWVVMKRITDSDGHLRVFGVERLPDGASWLYAYWANLNVEWNLDAEVVFRLRQ